MIGLDTSALIDLFKEDKKLIEVISKIDDEFFLNDFVYLELMHGLDLENKKHKMEESFYESYFKSSKSFQLDLINSKKARDIIWKLRKKGQTIGLIDATIAAIYLSNGVKTILTKNKKDFENIEGLKVISY